MRVRVSRTRRGGIGVEITGPPQCMACPKTRNGLVASSRPGLGEAESGLGTGKDGA